MNHRDQYVDLHCHPSLKPFGKSFNFDPPGIQAGRRSSKRNLWYYDPPSVLDKLLNYFTGLTKFSQSNFSSLSRGDVGIVCVSLYPLEKWFVRNKIKNELILDLASNFALGIGDKRIDYIQGIEDYYTDLENQYQFYLQLDGKEVSLPEGRFRYKLVRNYQEIEDIQESEQEGRGNRTICVVVSIEGLHVLNTGLGKAHDESEVLANLEKIRNWEYRPFFVTFAHHFWNHLCGHAESLSGIILKYADQSEGLDTGFTPLGLKVLERLLDNNEGKRIHIDIKHMSPVARREYYALLDSGNSAYQGVPLIISHGACNGLASHMNQTISFEETGSRLNPVRINFYDDEIVRLARSGGIIGLQLDERRIAHPETLKATKKSVKRSKIMHYRSALLWNQIEHIATLLDSNGLFAWDCMGIGSDFDGIIDSLNGFWTARELPFLADFLERHAYNYMQNPELKLPNNLIDADEIVARIWAEMPFPLCRSSSDDLIYSVSNI
ncbi:membrane dipeptidase [Lentiprolixibacter aurantiacus]|uniref:Membrane dipeptidase n=1 Tax=Lentiprolixibacter aurantiacus TaxID=2993939 RepID=A0AAE3MLG2_9FLAO|nr:membrane dipeptidase [Lentiprolixibacter aurantiacus]MCX2719613.1 membrane dipeptidase [Lentiprolixibacter aurantiacus]